MGAGKSTLVDFLRVRFGVTPYFEPNEQNPYLQDFYGDMPRWAFASQIYFLQKKFALHLRLEQEDGVVVQDRTIYEDAEVFAANMHELGILSDRDFGTYQELYRSIRARLRPPDLLIYLRCGLRSVRQRIRRRGRPEEQGVDPAYVRRLTRRYDAWFDRYDLSPTVTVQTDRLDYVSDLVHRIDLLETIGRYLA